MKRTTKIQLAVYIITLAVLGTIWAVTGYQNTWLYLTLVPVTVPNAWWVALFKKNKDQ